MRAAIPQSAMVTYQDVGVVPPDLHRQLGPGVNEYDSCLLGDWYLWDDLIAHGGLHDLCCPKGQPQYKQRPWIAMPKEGRRFKPIATFAVSGATFDSSNQLILTEQVPIGYDGVIIDIICQIQAPGGSGFIEGSGDVTWRLSADGRYLQDMGDLTVSVGSLIAPSPVPRGGIRVYSGNVLNFTAAFAPSAAPVLNPAGRVICSITGWYYPRVFN